MADVPPVDDELGLEPTPEEIEGWATALAVAAQFGKSRRWVAQMVRSGQLHPKLDSQGTRRFDPDEVEALLPNASTVAIQNQDGIVRILSDNARVLAANNADLLKILPGPMRELCQNQATLIGQLFTRIRELESERVAMLKDQEQARTDSHQRKLERLKTKAEQARLDTALKNFSEAVPKFFEQLFIGRDVQALIGSLDPTMLEALTSDDIPLLTTEQKARIKGIAAKLQERQLAGKPANGNGTPPKELPEATFKAPEPPKTEVVA
jgi:hypothetical protein